METREGGGRAEEVPFEHYDDAEGGEQILSSKSI